MHKTYTWNMYLKRGEVQKTCITCITTNILHILGSLLRRTECSFVHRVSVYSYVSVIFRSVRADIHLRRIC